MRSIRFGTKRYTDCMSRTVSTNCLKKTMINSSFLQSKRFKIATTLLGDMINNSSVPTPQLLTKIMVAYNRSKLYDKVIDIFNKSRPEFGVKANEGMTYNYLLALLSSDNVNQAFRTLVDAIQDERNDTISNQTINQILKILVFKKNYREAENIFRVAFHDAADRFQPDGESLTNMIKIYIKTHRLDIALNLYRNSEKLGVILDDDNLRALINECCRAGFIDEVDQIFASIKLPKVDDYVNMIWIRSKRSFEEAKEIYDKMMKMGYISNSYAIHKFACILIQRKYCAEALEIIYEGIRCYNIKPNLEIVCDILYAMVTDGKMTEAQSFFDSMPVQTLRAYEHLMHGYLNAGMYGCVEELFKEITRVKCMQPRLSTLHSMLLMYSRTQRYDEAIAMFQEMERSFNVKPDLLFYNIILSMYTKIKSIDDAAVFFNRIPDKDIYSFNILLTAISKKGSIENMERAYNDMLKSNIKANAVTHSILINTYFSHGETQKAKLILDQTTDKNVDEANGIKNRYKKLENSG